MKVALFSTRNYERKHIELSSKGKHDLRFIEESLSKETAKLAAGADAVSVFTNDDVSAEVLNALAAENVKYIAVRATGHDNVNSSYAKQLGLRSANVPEYSPYAIAEHTVALMLALNRKLIQADKGVKSQNFSLDQLIGFDFNGKKMGVIGCGKIGSIVARIMHGFGCSILIHDLQQNEELVTKYQAEYCSLDKLAKEADIISVHVPLNSATKYLINSSLISKMKKGVMIINTGRGGVTETKALIDGLKSGQIGYLGMDVYEYEKGLFFYDHSSDILQDDLFARLITFKNVLITGHQAFLTETALQNIADTTVYNLDQWAKGEISPFELS